MVEYQNDTIVALSSAPGRSALATVRLSGPDAIGAVAARFRGPHSLVDAPPNTLHVGRLISVGGDLIDEVVVGIFREPHSYTAEDVVEISCHGNPIIVSRVLDIFVAAGIRPAEPGEFTRRAFVNGRIDLSQAESVSALIGARSEAAARAALRQLGGEATRILGGPRRDLLSVLASVEAHIDFPEDDLSPFDRPHAVQVVATVETELEAICESVRRGRPLARSTTVVIAGRPNVGKSSIFNALLRRDRSIVHDTPGTTRDVVDAELVLGELPIRLVDTAGLAESRNQVEAEGVRRSHGELKAGDRILLVVDAREVGLGPDERDLIESIGVSRALLIANKIDLGRRLVETGPLTPHFVSALHGDGVEALGRSIVEAISGGEGSPADVFVVGMRQERLLDAAREGVRESRKLLEGKLGLELVGEELRRAANALGEITGENVGEDILNVIFSEFCIGK